MKNNKDKKKKNKQSRRERLKYAASQGKKAYKQGGAKSGLTKAREILVGKNFNGFAKRLGLAGALGASYGGYKIGKNVYRASNNIADATGNIRNSTLDLSTVTGRANKLSDLKSLARQGANRVKQGAKDLANQTTNRVKQGATDVYGRGRNLVDKQTREYIERLRSGNITLPFSHNSNNLNFMSYHNEYANFSEEELGEAFGEALEEIEEQYQAGALTADEADDLEDELEEELEEILEEMYEEEDDFSVYNGELASFSAGTELGQLIMEYVVSEDPEDPEETILDLAYNLGMVDEDGYELDEEEAVEGVLGLLTGEVIPDESLLIGLASYFGMDEEQAEEIIDLTEDEYEANGLFDDDYDYDDDDDDDYDDDDGYIDELEGDIEDLEEELEDVGELAEQAFSRIQNMEANFAIAEAESAVSREFNELEQEAHALVQSGQMPPHVFEDNYGNFSDAETQLAAFSQVCHSRGVDYDSELYRLDGINETYADLEPNISFSQMSYSDQGGDDYDVDDATLAQAVRNVRGRTYGTDFGRPIDFGGTQQAVAPDSTSVGAFGNSIQTIGEQARAF